MSALAKGLGTGLGEMRKKGHGKGRVVTSTAERAIAAGLSRHIDFQPQSFRWPELGEYADKITKPESVSNNMGTRKLVE
jgi:hypothetical protein